MNKILSLPYLKVLVIAAFILTSLQAKSQSKIRIKFNSEFQSSLTMLESTALSQTAEGYVQTGIASLDNLLVKHQVAEVKRVFRSAGKFEKRHREFGLHLWYEVSVSAATVTQYAAYIEEYKNLAMVQIAEAELEKKHFASADGGEPIQNFVPNDPRYSEQWHYNNTGQTGGTVDADIDLEEAWEFETGSDEVVIAIIDGGVDYNHEDLAAAMWVNTAEANGTTGVDDDMNGYIDDVYGYGFGDDEGMYTPGDHGTHVGGTVGAVSNNGIGVSGVAGGSGSADGVRLMSCAAFGSYNSDGFAEAFVYAADMGASISQNSWGYSSPGYYEQSVLDAIDYFTANAGMNTSGEQVGPMAGGLVIFAAGNDDADDEWYPGYYESVLSVSATNHNDQKSWYSNYGTWVDVAAPGGETMISEEGVLSTLPGNTYGFYQGTSMACPHVSGLAGLILSQYGEMGFSNNSLWELIVNTTDEIDDLNPSFIGKLGRGRINAFNALGVNDSINPDKISDLAVYDSSAISVSMLFTATGASGTEGRASSYDIRYSENKIDSANYALATPYYSGNRPQISGSADTIVVSGLVPGTKYYFALKASDVFGNKSTISNIDSATTMPAPILQVTPQFLSSTLDSGQTEIKQLQLENVGEGPLSYTINSQGSYVVSGGTEKNNTSYIAYNYIPEKGKDDTRVGHPVSMGSGDDGDEGYGYSWIDSDEIGGPEFNWMDISATGIAIYLSDDDSEMLTMPFDFEFYGEDYSQIYVSSNGFISFDSGNASSYSNTQLPTSSTPNNLIAGFWDDLNPSSGGNIYYEATDNQIIIQFSNVQHYNSSDMVSFQYILSDNGTIQLQYLDVGNDFSENTVGIENIDGTDGLQVAFNTAYLHDSLSVLFKTTPDVSIISTIDPISGVLNPAESILVDVTISSDSLVAGNYSDNVGIGSNDPLNPFVQIPVSLHVNGTPLASVDTDTISFNQVFVNDTVTKEFDILNIGTDSLKIDSISSTIVEFNVEYQNSIVYKNERVRFSVRFTPSDAVSYTDTLIVYTNTSEGADTIILSGEGAMPPVMLVTPTHISEALFTGETKTRYVTIDNTAGESELLYTLSIEADTSNLNSLITLPEQVIEPQLVDGELLNATLPALSNAYLTDLTGVNIAFYGSVESYIANDLTQRNADVFTVYSINTNQLDTIDIFYIDDDIDGMIANDIDILNAWISNGGSLVLCGDNAGSITELNSVLNNLNVTAVETSMHDSYIDSIGSHVIADSVEQIYSSSYGVYFTGTVNNSDVLLYDEYMRMHALALNAGFGKVLAIGNELSTIHSGGYDGRRFTNQAFSWLANRISNDWLVIDENVGTIAANTVDSVEVILDATGLNGGSYHKRIIVESNDPINPKAEIPVLLEVTGAPVIYTSPSDSLDFGDVLIGGTVERALTIKNIGSDLLVVDTIYFDSAYYSTDAEQFELYPGEEKTLTIACLGTYRDNRVNTMYIVNNTANDILTLKLTSNWVLPPRANITPESFVFNLSEFETETGSIRVSNNLGGSNLYFTTNFLGKSPSWLSISENADSVPAGGFVEIPFTVVANVSQGHYQTTVYLVTNDSEQRFVEIPIELNVKGISMLEYAEDTISFGTIAQGNSVLKQFSISNLAADSVTITNIVFDNGSPFKTAETSNITIQGTDEGIPAMAVAVQVDGYADDWNGVSSFNIESLAIGEYPYSESDLSATWQAVYSQTHLFVMVKVKDDVVLNSNISKWDDDCVEIHIDGDNSKGTSYDGVNDFHFVFGYGDSIAGGNDNNPADFDLSDIDFKMIAVSDGYQFECAIPLASLGVNPTASYEFGFDVQVGDNDRGYRETKLAWYADNDYSYYDPSVFGDIYFAEATSINIPIVFNPAQAGIYAESMRLYTTDMVDSVIIVPLKGICEQPLAPSITLGVTSIKDTLLLNESSSHIVSIGNINGEANLSYSIDFADVWLSVLKREGEVPKGEYFDNRLYLYAVGLEPGIYTSELLMSTNDPSNAEIAIEVELTVVDGSGIGTAIAEEVRLTNYPNPFSGETHIEFTLVSAAEVEFFIYNSMGQQVDVIAAQTYMAGTSVIKYNAENLSSGMYYIKMRNSEGVHTGHFMLVE